MDPPCSIEQLPNELLLYIFELIPRHYRNLLRATLVCSRWNALIGSSSKLMDGVTLRINLRNSYSLKYYNILSRSVRHYQNLVIQSEGERSFTVAMLTVRKLGPHLRELCFTSCITKPMPYSRMKEFDVGLEESDRAMWEQELDSFDRSLLPIDEYRNEQQRRRPAFDKLCDRQMVEIFCAVMYRYCARLERLTIQCGASFPLNYWTRFSLYEGNQMEHLKEMRLFDPFHLVLAKSTSLRKLQLCHVIAGPPLYASLGQTFPMLTHLEIEGTVFDDPCLWAVSQHCPKLEELLLDSREITPNGFRYIHQLQQLRKLDTTCWECNFDVFEALPVEILSIQCNTIKMETIYRMFRVNANMKQCQIIAKSFTYAGRETFPLGRELREMRPTCETIISWL